MPKLVTGREIGLIAIVVRFVIGFKLLALLATRYIRSVPVPANKLVIELKLTVKFIVVLNDWAELT